MQDADFQKAFEEALDFCDGEEDSAAIVATAALDSGTCVEDAFTALQGLLPCSDW